MRSSSIIYFIVLIYFVHYGDCIKCYSCISTESAQCLEPESSEMARIQCDSGALSDTRKFAEQLGDRFSNIYEAQIPDAAIQLSCIKQVSRVRGVEIVFRGCQLPTYKLDICRKVQKEAKNNMDGVDVKYCSLCDTDGCNGAGTLYRYGPGVTVLWALSTLIKRLL